jgi:hypothetical protein
MHFIISKKLRLKLEMETKPYSKQIKKISFEISLFGVVGVRSGSDGIARNERPGIEDIRRHKKALKIKAFLL